LGPLALLLVFIMIFAAFRNIIETMLIFLCLPFALVGGVLALMITGIPFSVSAGGGFIALSYIALLNGVVLVNNFNNLRDKGKTGSEVIKKGALLRLRPVIIGGILSSTILTLIVLPLIYSSLEKWILTFNQENNLEKTL
jgi:cobalt-zinc-cadmium resistance protein CzcA